MRRRRRNQLSSHFGYPEPLEGRDLLAGHGFGEAAHFSQGFAAWVAAERALEASSAPTAQVARASASTGRLTSETAGLHAGLTATLTDPNSTATGTASLKTYTSGGVTETEFKVNVTGATADTTLSVSVGDTVVGEITTDANGAGRLILSSDPSGDEQQLPANFPSGVAAGTAITVGPLSGTLAQGNSGHQGCHGEDHSNLTRLRAPLTDSEGTATGSVQLRTGANGDTANTRFVVRVSGATANSSLDVAIDGTVVGQVTTNASGSGKLVLASHPGNDEQSLPANFPTTIAAGSTVTVGTLSGTFETSEHGLSAARFVRFRR
jgi:hypothetical protein